MPVVTNTVTDPAGNPVRAVVTIRLIAGDTGYEPGYTDTGVVNGTTQITADEDGAWSVTLVSNEDIDPADTYYEVVERVPGRQSAYQHYISVPDTAGPFELADILVTEPESPEALAIAVTQKGVAGGVPTLDENAQIPLNQLGNAPGGSLSSSAPTTSAVGDAAAVGVASTAARGDHRHGREAFGAVTAQTTHGAASGNGAATTLARSDHVHGTPALPTAADVGAATSGHDHTGTYQPVDTDLTVIAGLTPSNDDVLQRKAGAWANRTIAQLKTDLAIALADVSGLQAALDAKAPALVVRNLRVEEATNLTFPSTSGNWQFLTGLAVSIPAAVGDYVELTWAFMWDTTGNNFLDWHINVGDSIVLAMSSDTATPEDEGAPWLYPGADAFDKSPGPWGIEVTAPMLSAGNLTCQLAAKAVGSGTIFRSTTYPFTAKLKNFGPADVA
jgi:hypothetical protein